MHHYPLLALLTMERVSAGVVASFQRGAVRTGLIAHFAISRTTKEKPLRQRKRRVEEGSNA